MSVREMNMSDLVCSWQTRPHSKRGSPVSKSTATRRINIPLYHTVIRFEIPVVIKAEDGIRAIVRAAAEIQLQKEGNEHTRH